MNYYVVPFVNFQRLWFLPSDVNSVTDIKKIKAGILLSLNEFQMEMENSSESLAAKALQDVLISEHSDIVMTYKFSKSETLKVISRLYNSTNFIFVLILEILFKR